LLSLITEHLRTRITAQGTDSDYDVQALSLGIRGDFIDAFALSGAINRYEFSLTSGDVDLGGSPNKSR
jgi:hypothetical protein